MGYGKPIKTVLCDQLRLSTFKWATLSLYKRKAEGCVYKGRFKTIERHETVLCGYLEGVEKYL